MTVDHEERHAVDKVVSYNPPPSQAPTGTPNGQTRTSSPFKNRNFVRFLSLASRFAEALELVSFPVMTIDTADHLAALLARGDREVEELERDCPDGASAASRAEAAELIASWREISPAISLRAAECEGTHRAAMDEARLLAECATLTAGFRLWERRTAMLLLPAK